MISFTQPGFGGSGNKIGLMAPDKEIWDFVRLVNWAICHLRENAPLENATAEENADTEYDRCGISWGESLLSNDSGTALNDFDDDVALGTIGYSYGGDSSSMRKAQMLALTPYCPRPTLLFAP